jgi:hypothetical protein
MFVFNVFCSMIQAPLTCVEKIVKQTKLSKLAEDNDESRGLSC